MRAAALDSNRNSRGRCRECGQTVEWVKTRNDRNMPLDPEPAGFGLPVLPGEPGSVVIRDGVAHVLRRGTRAAGDEALRVPHFTTCPKRSRRDEDAQRVLRRATEPKFDESDWEAERSEPPDPLRLARVLRALADDLERWDRRNRA
jgi:hypothetical protein